MISRFREKINVVVPVIPKRNDIMPVFKDEERKTYYVKCYYTDYTGTKRQRKKRGFARQKDAKERERNLLETQQADLTMTFKNFVKI